LREREKTYTFCFFLQLLGDEHDLWATFMNLWGEKEHPV